LRLLLLLLFRCPPFVHGGWLAHLLTEWEWMSFPPFPSAVRAPIKKDPRWAVGWPAKGGIHSETDQMDWRELGGGRGMLGKC
jgi:hypothetical protein